MVLVYNLTFLSGLLSDAHPLPCAGCYWLFASCLFSFCSSFKFIYLAVPGLCCGMQTLVGS